MQLGRRGDVKSSLAYVPHIHLAHSLHMADVHSSGREPPARFSELLFAHTPAAGSSLALGQQRSGVKFTMFQQADYSVARCASFLYHMMQAESPTPENVIAASVKAPRSVPESEDACVRAGLANKGLP